MNYVMHEIILITPNTVCSTKATFNTILTVIKHFDGPLQILKTANKTQNKNGG